MAPLKILKYDEFWYLMLDCWGGKNNTTTTKGYIHAGLGGTFFLINSIYCFHSHTIVINKGVVLLNMCISKVVPRNKPLISSSALDIQYITAEWALSPCPVVCPFDISHLEVLILNP